MKWTVLAAAAMGSSLLAGSAFADEWMAGCVEATTNLAPALDAEEACACVAESGEGAKDELAALPQGLELSDVKDAVSAELQEIMTACGY